MSDVAVNVRGLDSLRRELDKMPLKVQKRIARPAVTKAVTPLVKAAKKLTPRGKGLKPNGEKRKHLKQTIIKTVKTYSSGTVFAVVGPQYGPAPHAHLVHDGTKPHLISTTSVIAIQPKRKNGKVIFTKTIRHPGAKKNPFLEMAFSNTQDQVMRTLETGLSQGLDKEYAKASSV